MYVQRTPKKREMRKSPPETVAAARAQEMKEEHILNESKPAASLTMSAEKRTIMKKLVKESFPLFSTYNVNFRILAEEHRLGDGDNLGENMDFVLAVPPYDGRKD